MLEMERFKKYLIVGVNLFGMLIINFMSESAMTWSLMIIPIGMLLSMIPQWKTGFASVMGLLISMYVVEGNITNELLVSFAYDSILILFLTTVSIKNNLSQIIDPLTKVFNRKFYNRFIENKNNLKRLTIQILDIDHFKKINDTYGHPCGDYVLAEMIKVVKSQVRKTDMVCRYGGEEFAILSKNTSKNEGLEIAERICESIRNTKFIYEGQVIPVTVSIGVAAQRKPQEAKTLFDIADKALYRAKRSGRNQVQVSAA